MPGPSSAIVITTSRLDQVAVISTRRSREVDGVLDQVGKAVDDARPALADGLGAGSRCYRARAPALIAISALNPR